MITRKTKQDISFALSLLANKLRFGFILARENGDRVKQAQFRARFNRMQKLVYNAGGHVYDHNTHSTVEL